MYFKESGPQPFSNSFGCKQKTTNEYFLSLLLLLKDCIHTLPRGGMYWEIHPPGPERFPEGCKIPRDDVFLIFAQGRVRKNTVPRAVFPRTLPRAQGVYWIIWSPQIMSFGNNPVVSEYQEIHPYRALNIDIVKINTSLIMMRE